MTSIKKLWIPSIIFELITKSSNPNSSITPIPTAQIVLSHPQPSNLFRHPRFHHFSHHVSNNHPPPPPHPRPHPHSSFQPPSPRPKPRRQLKTLRRKRLLHRHQFRLHRPHRRFILGPRHRRHRIPPWCRYIHRNRLRNRHCLPSRSRHDLRSMPCPNPDDHPFRRSLGRPHPWPRRLQLLDHGELGRYTYFWRERWSECAIHCSDWDVLFDRDRVGYCAD